jgi:hypothetical protein
VYVCEVDDDYPLRYIFTDKVLPSPPISATPSAKPSVAKSEVSVKISSKQRGEYMYGKGSCKKPSAGVLLLDEQPLEHKPPSVNLKKVVTFKEDVREVKLDNKISSYQEGLDFYDKYDFKMNFIRSMYGTTKKYQEFKERRFNKMNDAH